MILEAAGRMRIIPLAIPFVCVYVWMAGEDREFRLKVGRNIQPISRGPFSLTCFRYCI